MARQVVINVVCDKCSRTVIETEAQSVEFVVPEGEYEIDLCLNCYKRFWGAYIELGRPLTKRGKKLLRESKPPGEFPCPVPDCDYKGVSPNAVGIHKFHSHGIRGKMHDGDDQFPCKECDYIAPSYNVLGGHMARIHGIKVDYPCDVEGCDYVAPNAQGLGTHKTKKHGMVGASAAARRRQALA